MAGDGAEGNARAAREHDADDDDDGVAGGEAPFCGGDERRLTHNGAAGERRPGEAFVSFLHVGGMKESVEIAVVADEAEAYVRGET